MRVIDITPTMGVTKYITVIAVVVNLFRTASSKVGKSRGRYIALVQQIK